MALLITIKNIQHMLDQARKEVELNNEDRERELDSTGAPLLDEDELELKELEKMLAYLRGKADGLNSYSFSSMTDQHLTKMNIAHAGFLKTKSGARLRGLEQDSVGADEIWSSKQLNRHIRFLETFIPRKNEAASRLWINAFFFRAAYILQKSSQALSMVLSVEQHVPAVTLADLDVRTLGGYIDWTAVWTDVAKAKRYLKKPLLEALKDDASKLFVSEAKGPDQDLENHVPQAIGELYGCARSSGQSIIRGVLTNGCDWIFLILTLDKGGVGGKYVQSQVVSFVAYGEVTDEGISLVSAIIAHWIVCSHKALDQDDYFDIDLTLR